MSEAMLEIESHKGRYQVLLDDSPFVLDPSDVPAHYVVDRRVAELYPGPLQPVLQSDSVLLIDASEHAKSLERFPAYVDHLVERKLRRGHRMVAIGGGIVQDITCFLASTMLRGVPWEFYPTTLLAQADSCIGSKSSINSGKTKNILGTFTPPTRIRISMAVLDTLEDVDVRSGIGEMLKVHAIEDPAEFDKLAADYDRLTTDKAVLARYVRRSLEFKQKLIEIDEFDQGPRNVMNYGHSFGHAIEAVTDFGVPHGIAVTLGMDLANFFSWRRGIGAEAHYRRMSPALRKNYAGFERTPIDLDGLLGALSRDKKNTSTGVRVILPDGDGRIGIHHEVADDAFRAICGEFLAEARTA